MNKRIPVTVLTGFLGSGKTTLLNRILSEEHGLRIAVIENEFGEIGIDQDLIINANEEVLEMNNGCICCTIRGDLIRILGDLAERKDKFDRVILETTGMADPGPVAQTFFVDPQVDSQYELDGIITLVDAKHVSKHLDDETDEVMAQIAFADRIILNKIDLISEGEHKNLKNRLGAINHLATVYPATMANAPIAELLDIGGFNLERALEIKPNFLEPEYPFEWGGIWNLPAGQYRLQLKNGPDPEMSVVISASVKSERENMVKLAEQIFPEFSKPAKTLQHQATLSDFDQHYELILQGREDYQFKIELSKGKIITLFTQHTPEEFSLELLDQNNREQSAVTEHYYNAEHEHDSSVSSVSIEMEGSFDMTRINAWLNIFLSIQGPDIYRMKGVVAVKGEKQRIVFQGVHMLFGSQAGKPWNKNETPVNRMVFIGKNLDESYIRKSLETCLA